MMAYILIKIYSGSTLVFTKPGFPTPDPPTPTIVPTTTSTTSIAPTTTSTTSIVSTTTSETAVSSTSAVPPPPANFRILAGGGTGSPAAGSVLHSNGQNTRSVMFSPVEAGLIPTTLTIETGTGHLIQSNGMYLCARYSFLPNYRSMLINCATEGVLDDIPYSFITCEQTADSKLVCSVPAVSCTQYYSEDELVTSCLHGTGTFNQFYTSFNSLWGYFVYLGTGSYSDFPGVVALDLKVEGI